MLGRRDEVMHDFVTEGRLSSRTSVQPVNRLNDVPRNSFHRLGLVRVSDKGGFQVELVLYSVQTTGHDAGKGQVRIGVGTGNTCFHAHALTVAHHAKATGPVVGAHAIAVGAHDPS